MQLTRTEKEQLVADLTELMEEYPVVGVLDMHSLPAKQLQEIKKELVGAAEIRMTRKTLIDLALDGADREDIVDLRENDATMPALIFSDDNPFSLFKLIQDKKTSAPASGGEKAPDDIELQEGKTDLDPGPMLGQIQQLGAPTGVEDGKIAIKKSAVIVKAGDTITREAADVLNTLGIEPLEVGLDLKLVYENGEIFDRSVLAIDVDEYRTDFEGGAAAAFNLAVNAGIMTEQTVVPLIQQGSSKAMNLAIEAGVINDKTVELLVSKAAGHAAGLDSQLDWDATPADDAGAAADPAEDAGDDEDAEEADADVSAEDDSEEDEE